MHAIVVAAVAALLSLWPVGVNAQCANQCKGDFNCNGQVTIDEIIVSVNNALYDCPAPGPRFIDNGNGTITDTSTGLQWEKKDDWDNEPAACPGSPSCTNPHDADNQYSWSADGTDPNGSAYTDFLAKLNAADGFAGHTDWRLPTAAELQGLLEYGQPGPLVASAFNTECTADCTVVNCSCTALEYYWSTTTVEGLPDDALSVDFNYGLVNPYTKTIGDFLRVRAVRGS